MSEEAINPSQEPIEGAIPPVEGKLPIPPVLGEEAKVEAIKALKVKLGEQEIELPYTTKFDLSTKSGKTTQVSLEEMINDVWGKSEVSRRINEAEKLKQTN